MHIVAQQGVCDAFSIGQFTNLLDKDDHVIASALFQPHFSGYILLKSLDEVLRELRKVKSETLYFARMNCCNRALV